VVDALSQKVKFSALQMVQEPELATFAVEGRIKTSNFRVQPEWLQKLKEAQEAN
jgi:hypothetical protein